MGQEIFNSEISMGSGCGSVGRAFASDTQDQLFESSHRLIFMLNICKPIVNCIEKTK